MQPARGVRSIDSRVDPSLIGNRLREPVRLW